MSVSVFSKNNFNQGMNRMVALGFPDQLRPKLEMRHKDAQAMRRHIAEYLGAIAPSYRKGATATTLGAVLYRRTYKPLFDKLGWQCNCGTVVRDAVEEGCQNAAADAEAAAAGVDNTQSPFASTKSFARYAKALADTLGLVPETMWAAGGREMMLLDGVESIVGGALQEPTKICEVFACLADIGESEKMNAN